MRSLLLATTLLLVGLTAGFTRPAPPTQDDANGWTMLFNGENLDGWIQRNGEAEYRVENGTIVGISKLNTPNSFLCTEQNYSDFILEYDVMVDPRLNSGVQIRSLSTPEYRNGRVHGYQVELDPSPRAYTGGIYDEARRGWLYPLSRNPEGQAAFRQGEWNTIRVEAIGPTIRTWVNGQMAANLVDDMTAEGFIALQVHSIGRPEQEGTTVRWRNIRIKTTDLEQERWPVDPDVPEISYLTNTLTDWEKRHGWRLLWDGQTTEGWRGARLDHFPTRGWRIEDGVLIVEAADGAESGNGGDIVTVDTYSDFELELEFRITEGANSGIKYFVQTDLNQGPGSAIGLEYQILDDQNHPDAGQGVAGNRTVASLYDLIPAENLSVPSRGKPFNGVGAWNKARIVVRGDHVEHWLNNFKVVEYERGTQMYRALVQNSKYARWENFGEWEQGHLLLQDHGDEVHFRSIKIREL
ncbi:hypothetical protein AWN76_001625 [Rhodothermaceae bacterium RA]|nr:hypothetical protein AWN76_001625 [Rhodothermaceae bacterium RA]